jgi:hypothetical protein
MPNITNISKIMRMKKTNIPQDILVQLGFDTAEYKFISNKHSFETLVKINDLLTTEQKYAVMEQHGCHKSGKMDKESKEFGKKHSNKSIVEKLEILSAGNSTPCTNDDGTKCYAMITDDDAPCMNDDGSISYAVMCFIHDSEIILDSCHCLRGNYKEEFLSYAKEHPDKILSFVQFFCGCCAGHQKHHLQNKLGVKLKLKSINISSVKTDKGQKRVFIYEIVQ